MWPLGSLAVHRSFHIFYFLELPHSVAAVLGLSFLSKQLSILALFLAGALGTSRIVTAALFSFEWIPGAITSLHKTLRNLSFATLSLFLIFLFMPSYMRFDALTYEHKLSLAGIALLGITTALISFILRRKFNFGHAGGGAAMLTVAFILGLLPFVASARMEFLTNEFRTEICLKDGRSAIAAVVAVEKDLIVFKRTTTFGGQIWGLVPKNEVSAVIDRSSHFFFNVSSGDGGYDFCANLFHEFYENPPAIDFR